MPSGQGESLDGLPHDVGRLLETARRGVMTTVDPDGSPHAVPVVFAVFGDEIVSPIDHKPKTGKTLARVKNLQQDNRVTLLIDLWDEDWTKLAWLMVRGRAEVDTVPEVEAMRAINARYPQYEIDEVHDALIRIQPVRLSWWAWR
jgi:PPOX class probable F420-dependent enzyme